MTIDERIWYLKEFVADTADHVAFEENLYELLEQVAKEQRKLCSASARRMYSKNTGKIGVSKESILNAPSPLNEDSHE